MEEASSTSLLEIISNFFSTNGEEKDCSEDSESVAVPRRLLRPLRSILVGLSSEAEDSSPDAARRTASKAIINSKKEIF